jgi:energy-coupling factor transporter ATP-binding protein EcfA2
MTILLVEQNAKLALEVSQRGYVMESGEITLTDESKDTARRPEGARQPTWANSAGGRLPCGSLELHRIGEGQRLHLGAVELRGGQAEHGRPDRRSPWRHHRARWPAPDRGRVDSDRPLPSRASQIGSGRRIASSTCSMPTPSKRVEQGESAGDEQAVVLRLGPPGRWPASSIRRALQQRRVHQARAPSGPCWPSPAAVTASG